MELRRTIELEVERLGLPSLRAELVALQHELWNLGKREAELRRSISLWDRWMIFSDTPDERQLKGGRRRRSQVEKSLGFVRGQVARANATLGELCPPFAVAVGLGECVSLAYTGLEVEGWLLRRVGRGEDLQAALGGLVALLRRTYFPRLDFGALRVRLSDASACQALSGLADRPLRMATMLGHAPLEDDAPLGKVAERLLDNGFFAARYREDELVQRCASLESRADEADAEVGWWERINVLSDSPDEQVRDEALTARQAAQDELRRVIDRQQRLLHDAMRAYPPLDFYHGVAEALGIARLLQAETEPVITAKGDVEKLAVIAPRALLLAAVRRLRSVFAATFPGVPAPHELESRAGGDEPSLRGRPEAEAFIARAAASARMQGLREEALAHAGAVGHIDHELESVEDQISLIDRLVFWSDTDAERAAKTLVKRAEANTTWTWQLWRAMLAEARRVGATIGPLAARDAALGAIAGIEAIHTDRGSSSVPKNCQVYKREEALAALQALRRVFEALYGVRGSMSQLMAATVAATVAATPREHAVYEDAVHRYAPIEAGALHELLAARAGPVFIERYRAAAQRTGQIDRADSERADVEQDISVWDRINIFKTTEAEARRDELKAELGGLRGELGQLRSELMAVFEHALRGYPPALLGAEIDPVIEAVDDIRAVCRSYTVTVGSGKNRTTQTRYRCELVGKGAAVQAMKRWAARMVQVFGEQLGYHELLEAAELEPVAEEQS